MTDRRNENDLITRLRAGDEAAFREIVSAYHGSLVRLAMTFLSQRSIAEEVVQETWLAVIRGLGTFEGRSSLKTWIFRILANRARTRAKREARSIPFSALGNPQSEYEPVVNPNRFDTRGMWVEPPQSWTNDTPEQILERRDTMEVVQRSIGELPPSQRAVVVLHDVEGLDPEEICNILEISETNRRVMLHRARSSLRGALEKHLTEK